MSPAYTAIYVFAFFNSFIIKEATASVSEQLYFMLLSETVGRLKITVIYPSMERTNVLIFLNKTNKAVMELPRSFAIKRDEGRATVLSQRHGEYVRKVYREEVVLTTFKELPSEFILDCSEVLHGFPRNSSFSEGAWVIDFVYQRKQLISSKDYSMIYSFPPISCFNSVNYSISDYCLVTNNGSNLCVGTSENAHSDKQFNCRSLGSPYTLVIDMLPLDILYYLRGRLPAVFVHQPQYISYLPEEENCRKLKIDLTWVPSYILTRRTEPVGCNEEERSLCRGTFTSPIQFMPRVLWGDVGALFVCIFIFLVVLGSVAFKHAFQEENIAASRRKSIKSLLSSG